MDTQPLYSPNAPARVPAPSVVQAQTKPANNPPDNEFMLRQVFSRMPHQAFTLLFRLYYPKTRATTKPLSQSIRPPFTGQTIPETIPERFAPHNGLAIE